MKTIEHLRIKNSAFCEPLSDGVLYDMSNGVRAKLSDPFLLDDGSVVLDARMPLKGNALVDHTEKMLRSRFHGRNGRTYFRLAEPKDHIISAEYFVEATLTSAERIDEALRVLTEPMTGLPWKVDCA